MKNDLAAHKTRECSANALKTVYYVIIGLAITEALNRAFVKDGSFLGLRIFEGDNLLTFILLIAFLPSICRFVHGASIHLDVISQKRYKPLYDFGGFFLQAALFYLMSASLSKPFWFVVFFGLMLFFDAIWLTVLWRIKYLDLDATAKQWLKSDFVLIGVFVLILLIDRTMACVWSVVAVVIMAWVATGFDYYLNREFYFPISQGTSDGKQG
jgi:hypothetical protein